MTLPSNVDPETQVLDLSGSNLQILPREAFMRATLLNLQKIYLVNCRIGMVDQTALRGLSNLVELDLSDNMLTNVPSEAFRDVTSLRELRLSANPIQKIDDGAFELLPGLVKLDLTDCRIEVLAPHAFQGLDQLSHLRLGGNHLTELKPRLMASLTRLHGIELHNNPWVCDCRLRPVRDWQQQYNVPSPVAAVCASPARLVGRALSEMSLDEFACPPEAVVSSGHPRVIEAVAGQNATLSCRMAAVPEAEITWLWRGRPLANSSGDASGFGVALAPDALTSPAALGVAAGQTNRAIIVLEEGAFDKISHLILSPVRETDAGEFVCVAANQAGLAKINLTLRVDAQPPTAGGLGSAQLAGLGAGLLILVAISVAVFFLVLLRCRGSKPSAATGAATKESLQMQQHQLQQQVIPQQDEMVNGFGAGHHYQQQYVQSPSSCSSLFEYGGTSSMVATSGVEGLRHAHFPTDKAIESHNKPDLIHETRRTVATNQHWNLGASSDAAGGQRAPASASLTGGRVESDAIDVVHHMMTAGEYLSAQTDSLYPSALWGHLVSDDDGDAPASAAGAPSAHDGHQLALAAINLPHVPLRGMDQLTPVTSPSHHHYCEPYLQQQQHQHQQQHQQHQQQQQQQQQHGESVSPDSYGYACRLPGPQQQPSTGLTTTDTSGSAGSVGSVASVAFVPYPADFGLPRTSSPLHCLPSATSTLGRSQITVTTDLSGRYPPSSKINSNSQWVGVGQSSPVSTESSPVSSVKSPRFWHRPQGSSSANGKRSFARDSPDEGYQEECATDVWPKTLRMDLLSAQ